MEDDLKRLISITVDDKEGVVSILGMGGIGKTTIARKVYNNIETKEHSFESFAWVCITQQCHVRTVFEEIFRQLIPQNKEENMHLSTRELIQQLQVQKDKRCMIVLDDLRNIDHWESLKHAFVVAGAKCKILLTTRKENIANVGFPYKLKLLNEDEGWEKLKKKAFPRNIITGLAYQIISYYPKLVNSVNVEAESPLHVLAKKPNVFKSSIRLGPYDSIIYHCKNPLPFPPKCFHGIVFSMKVN